MVLLDTAKGFAPALVATLVDNHLAGVLAGGAAMLGHWRPLFMGFKRGGKIVATTGGAFLGVAPVVGGIGAGIWILVFLLVPLRLARVDRRGALAAGARRRAGLPVAGDRVSRAWLRQRSCSCTSANIRRLAAGTENRFDAAPRAR